MEKSFGQKRMLKRRNTKKCRGFVFIILTIFLFSCMSVGASNEKNDKGETTKVLNPNLWVDNERGNKDVILKQSQIESLNKKNLTELKGIMYDLKSYPFSLSREELTKLLEGQQFPSEDRYLNGKKVEQQYYDELKKQINISGVQDVNSISYAVTVRRTNIRTLPTNDESLSEPDDVEFDNFQETEVQPVEPVLVLYKTLNKNFCFIQTSTYRGWMDSKDIAIANDKESWQKYFDTKEFLVITANKLRLGNNVFSPELSELEFDMGVKIPLISDKDVPLTVDNQSTYGNYVVKVPIRTENGGLGFKPALIPVNSDVSVGYMSYTRENIIKQAFKSLGERYGWGGMFNAKDCSSFIQNIFKCFGLMLPRNSDQQEKFAGKTFSFEKGTSEKDRYKVLDKMKPGSALYFPGHAMLYLGKYKGNYYIIHDFYAGGDINNKQLDGKLGLKVYNQVTVSELSICRRNGLKFVESLTVGKQFE